MLHVIKQDWAANKGNTRSRIIVLFFRLAQKFSRVNILGKFFLLIPYIVYRFVIQIFVGFDVPSQTEIGSGFRVFHCQSIVINPNVIIGKNCTIRHSTTIGNKNEGGGVPSIGDSVDIGCHTAILGRIAIADRTVVGAGSVVLSNSLPNSVMAGVPARIIREDR